MSSVFYMLANTASQCYNIDMKTQPSEKAKQEVLRFRRLLQKNAPDFYKYWAARKMSQYVTKNAVDKTDKRDIMEST